MVLTDISSNLFKHSNNDHKKQGKHFRFKGIENGRQTEE